MKRIMITLGLALLALSSCKEDLDPNKAFQNLAVQTTVDGPGALQWRVDDYFIAKCDNGWTASDFSDPANPQYCLGSPLTGIPTNLDEYFTSPGGDTAVLWYSDPHAIGSDPWYYVLDASNPLAIAYLGRFPKKPNFHPFAWRQGLLAAAENTHDMVLFDLSGLTGGAEISDVAPLELSRTSIGSLYMFMEGEFYGKYFYVGGNGSQLVVFDITDPSQPEALGLVNLQYVTTIEIQGDVLYIDVNTHIDQYDLSDPALPHPVGRYDTHREDFAVREGYLFTGHSESMKIQDISLTHQPELVKYFEVETHTVREIELFGDKALIGVQGNTYQNSPMLWWVLSGVMP